MTDEEGLVQGRGELGRRKELKKGQGSGYFLSPQKDVGKSSGQQIEQRRNRLSLQPRRSSLRARRRPDLIAHGTHEGKATEDKSATDEHRTGNYQNRRNPVSVHARRRDRSSSSRSTGPCRHKLK
ncbi:hypothetical protein GALMADRAFT_1136820 [Galerina marginata CBS 339.88]|uniref:Uncharacterized protein n=1 Tax=Galerina marginata (strain CBS 339.88) TaxID=685588 RepID=A0A067SJP1_GALM3|nr:hypothetical protein GALMADRAFT_1136820 [Galerina marginata CBS 339.88]